MVVQTHIPSLMGRLRRPLFNSEHRRFGDSAMDTIAAYRPTLLLFAVGNTQIFSPLSQLSLQTATSHQSDFGDNFWMQTAALLIVVAVLLEVAARYIW